MHIVFGEGVQLTSGATPSEEPAPGPPEEGRGRRPPEAGTDGGGEELLTGLSSGSFPGAGDAPHAPCAAAAAAAGSGSRSGQGGGAISGLSLTRFLSNVVVACSQVKKSIVLRAAALTSL